MLSFSSYFSPGYLALYLPAAVLLYALAGQRGRRAVLLLFSYVCFWAVSGKLIAYLLLSTLSMYHTGLWLAHDQARTKELLEETPKEERRALRARAQTKQRRILALGLLFQLGMLVVLKYTPFFLSNYNALLQALSLPVTLRIPHFLLPIGISFYTMQAASYLFDVSRRPQSLPSGPLPQLFPPVDGGTHLPLSADCPAAVGGTSPALPEFYAGAAADELRPAEEDPGGRPAQPVYQNSL